MWVVACAIRRWQGDDMNDTPVTFPPFRKKRLPQNKTTQTRVCVNHSIGWSTVTIHFDGQYFGRTRGDYQYSIAFLYTFDGSVSFRLIRSNILCFLGCLVGLPVFLLSYILYSPSLNSKVRWNRHRGATMLQKNVGNVLLEPTITQLGVTKD